MIGWNIDEARQTAKDLNNQGAHIRNAVAGIYNLYTYKISQDWSGVNYNKVVNFVNDNYEFYDRMTQNLSIDIPNGIQAIVNSQAEDGQGMAENFSFAINIAGDGEVGLYKIPLSSESPDGRIRITQENVERYFNGNDNLSIPSRTALLKEYLIGYINICEGALSSSQNNEAIKEAIEVAKNYKAQVDIRVQEISDISIGIANAEINKIEDANIQTTNFARKTANIPGYSTKTGKTEVTPYTKPINAGSIPGYSTTGTATAPQTTTQPTTGTTTAPQTTTQPTTGTTTPQTTTTTAPATETTTVTATPPATTTTTTKTEVTQYTKPSIDIAAEVRDRKTVQYEKTVQQYIQKESRKQYR